jgi:hypothetical protein
VAEFGSASISSSTAWNDSRSGSADAQATQPTELVLQPADTSR